MRRWSAAAGAVAAFGVGLIAFAATPAWAADQLELKVANANVQGKVGDKVQVGFTIKNNTKQPITGLTVVVTAPGNAVLEAGDNPGCAVGGAGHAATCRSNGTLAAGKSANGAIALTVKTAGQAAGRIAVEGGNADNFQLRAVGPTPSATTKSAKPTKTSSLSASETPGLTEEGSFAVPEAGNGVAIATTDAGTNKTSGSGGGMGLGLWVGIIAIVGALGLIGSLFYFRRRDRSEPDTGMHPVVPAPQGFYGGPAPTTYGSPPPPAYGAPPPQTYGPPAAQTQMINPNFGGAPGGPTQIIQPDPNAGPGDDRTVTFRRPDDL
ncbi:hypothetical protein ACPPVO_09735 [Dactylosporangium sp. McL0621]|uniref:hypothetical protein n=1 Tax=Dactylosporangium sp. McL0621 TaxID=3415678 RepID=UPI003CE7E63F